MGRNFIKSDTGRARPGKAKSPLVTLPRRGSKILKGQRRRAQVLVDLMPTFAGNRVTVRLTAAQTLAMAGTSGFLELEATSGTDTKILASGRVLIQPEVSE